MSDGELRAHAACLHCSVEGSWVSSSLCAHRLQPSTDTLFLNVITLTPKHKVNVWCITILESPELPVRYPNTPVCAVLKAPRTQTWGQRTSNWAARAALLDAAKIRKIFNNCYSLHSVDDAQAKGNT